MSDNLVILTRTFDMLDWLLPKSETFPKAYRYTLTQRMMTVALYFQEELFDGLHQSGSTRHKHFKQADAHLSKLRLYLRMVHHWGWLNDGQYRHISVMIAEIGKLLGGLMKKP